MLQIISKKFFKKDDPSTYHETDEKAIVYSNMGTLNKIETPVVTLERIESYNGITTYLMSYKNRIEIQQSKSFQLISVGHREIVSDFLCCCTFWFRGMFSTDKFYIEKLTRTQKEGIADSDLPVKIAPKFFKLNQNINQEQIEEFNCFIKNVIGLKRNEYCEVMKVLRQYQDAIVTMNSNMELSYTMFVASIESLAQKFDEFQTEWNDCQESIVKNFEGLFKELDVEVIDSIKSIIIEETHGRLGSRFESFCLKYIDQDFYKSDAVGIENPIRKSHLRKAIKCSYVVRSKYVHTLKELPDIVKHGEHAEIYVQGKNIYLTFPGMSRMTRYIINKFIEECEQVENEDVDYFNELPGVIQARMAPQYWVHNPEALNSEKLDDYLNNFVRYYVEILTKKEAINDCTKVCDKIESMIKESNNNVHKQKLLLIYVLYNWFLAEEYQVKDWYKFLECNEKIFDTISVESIIVHLLTFNKFPWEVEVVTNCYDDYCKKRFWKAGLKLPQILEVSLLLEIVNRYLENEDVDNAMFFMEKAIEEKPGDQFILDVSKRIKDRSITSINWQKEFFDFEGVTKRTE